MIASQTQCYCCTVLVLVLHRIQVHLKPDWLDSKWILSSSLDLRGMPNGSAATAVDDDVEQIYATMTNWHWTAHIRNVIVVSV